MKSNNLIKNHKELLGQNIPENYFEDSKQTILNKIHDTEINEVKTFAVNRSWLYAIAASAVIIFGMVWFFQNNAKQNPLSNEAIQWVYNDLNDETILIDALMIQENQMDQFVTDVLEKEVIMEAAIQEQQMDNIFINSMMVEDSILEDFIDEKILSNIIL